MLLSLRLQIATKCACPSVPLGLMRHVETAVDVTRLQPLRTSVSSLEEGGPTMLQQRKSS